MTIYQGTLAHGSGSMVAYSKVPSSSPLFADSLQRVASTRVGIDGSYSLPLTRAGEYVIRISTAAAAYPDFTVTATNGRSVTALTGVSTPVLRNTPTVAQTGSTGGGSTGGGGSASVLPKTALMNVQNANGSWDITAANVAVARAAGYRVYWVTDAAANQAPTAVDGLADKDVVNGAPALGVSAPAPTSVTIASNQFPTANDAANTANDTVVLTKVTGVTWTVDGVDHPSSAITGSTKTVPYTKGTNTTVTAKPESASYEITNQTRSWTLTFTNTGAPAPGTVIFSDDFGTSALTSAQVNARTTPVGGVTMTTAGSGSVTVNAAGHLVLDATAGNAAIDFNTAGTTGKLTMTVVSFTGDIGTVNMVEMNLRSGTTGNKAVGRIMPTTTNGYYYAQSMIAATTDYGTSITRVATYPSTFETTVTESGGSITTVIRENNANPSTHTKTGTFTGNGKVRIFVPTGGVLTISDVKLESV